MDTEELLTKMRLLRLQEKDGTLFGALIHRQIDAHSALYGDPSSLRLSLPEVAEVKDIFSCWDVHRNTLRDSSSFSWRHEDVAELFTFVTSEAQASLAVEKQSSKDTVIASQPNLQSNYYFSVQQSLPQSLRKESNLLDYAALAMRGVPSPYFSVDVIGVAAVYNKPLHGLMAKFRSAFIARSLINTALQKTVAGVQQDSAQVSLGAAIQSLLAFVDYSVEAVFRAVKDSSSGLKVFYRKTEQQRATLLLLCNMILPPNSAPSLISLESWLSTLTSSGSCNNDTEGTLQSVSQHVAEVPIGWDLLDRLFHSYVSLRELSWVIVQNEISNQNYFINQSWLQLDHSENNLEATALTLIVSGYCLKAVARPLLLEWQRDINSLRNVANASVDESKIAVLSESDTSNRNLFDDEDPIGVILSYSARTASRLPSLRLCLAHSNRSDDDIHFLTFDIFRSAAFEKVVIPTNSHELQQMKNVLEHIKDVCKALADMIAYYCHQWCSMYVVDVLVGHRASVPTNRTKTFFDHSTGGVDTPKEILKTSDEQQNSNLKVSSQPVDPAIDQLIDSSNYDLELFEAAEQALLAKYADLCLLADEKKRHFAWSNKRRKQLAVNKLLLAQQLQFDTNQWNILAAAKQRNPAIYTANLMHSAKTFISFSNEYLSYQRLATVLSGAPKRQYYSHVFGDQADDDTASIRTVPEEVVEEEQMKVASNISQSAALIHVKDSDVASLAEVKDSMDLAIVEEETQKGEITVAEDSATSEGNLVESEESASSADRISIIDVDNADETITIAADIQSDVDQAKTAIVADSVETIATENPRQVGSKLPKINSYILSLLEPSGYDIRLNLTVEQACSNFSDTIKILALSDNLLNYDDQQRNEFFQEFTSGGSVRRRKNEAFRDRESSFCFGIEPFTASIMSTFGSFVRLQCLAVDLLALHSLIVNHNLFSCLDVMIEQCLVTRTSDSLSSVCFSLFSNQERLYESSMKQRPRYAHMLAHNSVGSLWSGITYNRCKPSNNGSDSTNTVQVDFTFSMISNYEEGISDMLDKKFAKFNNYLKDGLEQFGFERADELYRLLFSTKGLSSMTVRLLNANSVAWLFPSVVTCQVSSATCRLLEIHQLMNLVRFVWKEFKGCRLQRTAPDRHSKDATYKHRVVVDRTICDGLRLVEQIVLSLMSYFIHSFDENHKAFKESLLLTVDRGLDGVSESLHRFSKAVQESSLYEKGQKYLAATSSTVDELLPLKTQMTELLSCCRLVLFTFAVVIPSALPPEQLSITVRAACQQLRDDCQSLVRTLHSVNSSKISCVSRRLRVFFDPAIFK